MKQHDSTTSTRRFRRTLSASLLGTMVSAALSAGTAHGATVMADFNGDGYEDLLVVDPTAPVEDNYQGVINVIATDSAGLRPGESAQTISSKQVFPYLGEWGNGFGNAVAVGDFNGDGRDELAVGAPYLDLGAKYMSGAVHVLESDANGLTHLNATNLYQYRSDLFNNRGYALASGDFNNDGYDDLAVGVPGMARRGESNLENGQAGVGGVEVYFGSALGVQVSVPMLLTRPYRQYAGAPQRGEKFGYSLASGDFNGDGFDDLLIGSPFASHSSSDGREHSRAGLVTLFFGKSVGFGSMPMVIRDVDETDNSNDRFGKSLAAGDFNGDGVDDFAIGHPDERVGSLRRAGAVTTYLGHGRLEANGWVSGSLWYQNRSGVPGRSEQGDYFGGALTSADFDGDGTDDLAIGVPGEDFEGTFFDDVNAGAVLALYGTRTRGLVLRTSAGAWDQDTPGIEGGRESYDLFGAKLSAGDLNADGTADLVIGVSGERVSGQNGQGVVQMIPGGYAGLAPISGQTQIYHRGNLRGVGGINFGQVLP